MASTKSELAKAQTSFQPTNALLLIRLCALILIATVAHHPVCKRETAIAKERGRDDSMESSSQDRVCIVEFPWLRNAKRCQEPFCLFLGLPCGRRVLSRPSRATIFLDHDSSPIGHPRLTLLRIAVNSASLCGSLTYSIQFAVLRTGQAESICLSLAVPIAQRQRLLHRHSSALDTKLARSALRSTYRHTVIKCRSS